MVTFLGDVAIISENLESKYKPCSPYILNFEYVYGHANEMEPQQGKINLCAPYIDFETIFGSKPVAVGIANNHIYDYGEAGVASTIKKLREAQIGVIGAERFSLDENTYLLAYVALEAENQFSFSFEKAKLDIENIQKENGSGKIIVQMHWGIENHPKQSAKQEEIAHWLIDQGVELIVGHHPHCIQPVEIYKGKYIFYSLGNGLFGVIDQPSHFNELGEPTRNYRFKWQAWNRESLAVRFDETTGDISVDILYQRKNTLVCKKENVEIERYMKTKRLANLVYAFRKYYLFFVSNAFTDGHIFDMNALKCELKR